MPTNNTNSIIATLGPESQWLQNALMDIGYSNIRRLSARSVAEVGVIVKLGIDGVVDLIRDMTVESEGHRGGEYLSFLMELVAQIKACRNDAVTDENAAYVQSLIDTGTSEDLQRSKETIIPIYKQYAAGNQFYGDVQYEGRALAQCLHVDLRVVVQTPAHSFELHVYPCKSRHRIVLHLNKGNGDGSRRDHYVLHSVNNEEIPHSILGDGDCLFASFAQAIMEVFLLNHSSHSEALVAKRRRAQTAFGMHWGMIPKSMQLAHAGVPSGDVAPREENFRVVSHDERMVNDRLSLETLQRNIEQLLTAKVVSVTDARNVGQLLESISWCEDDPQCVRNLHGFRNRHKQAGNTLNKLGAKLDFETLSHLSHYPDSVEYQKLWKVYHPGILQSLQVVLEKVAFILRSEFPNVTTVEPASITRSTCDSHDADVGTLLYLAAFANDVLCMDRMVGYLSDFSRKGFATMDLSNRIERYTLGYLFSLIGETAKEVSHFIKHTPGVQQPANCDSACAIFTQLGHYRQELKNHPSILRVDAFRQLENMRDRVADVCEPLVTYLKDLHEGLLMVLESKDLEEFYGHTLSSNEPPHDSEESKARKLTYFAAKCVDKYEHIVTHTELLAIGTTNARKRLDGITKQIATHTLLLQQLHLQKEHLQAAPITEAGTIPAAPEHALHRALSDVAFEGKAAKSFIELCKGFPSELLSTFSFLSTADTTLISYMREIFYITHPTARKGISEPKKESKLRDVLPKYRKCVDEALRNCGVQVDDATDYGVVLAPYAPAFPQNALDVKGLEDKISRKKKLLDDLEEDKKKFEPFANKYVPRELDGSSGELQQRLCGFAKAITRISEEIHFLNVIHSKFQHAAECEGAESASKLLLAAKSCFGIAAQACKELQSNYPKDLQPYLFTYSMLLKDMQRAISVRHKNVGHNVLHCDDHLVETTINDHVIPWRHTFDHIRVALSNSKDMDSIIRSAPIDFRLTVDVESLDESGKQLYVSYIMMRTWNEFMQSDAVIQEYHGLDLSRTGIDPVLLIEIHWQASLAFRNHGDFRAVCYILRQALFVVPRITSCETRDCVSFRLLCDLALALTQIDEYDEARKCAALASQQTLPQSLRIDKVTPEVLLASIDGITGQEHVARASFELIFVQHFSELKEHFPALCIVLLAAMIALYIHQYDFVAARDFKPLLDELLVKSQVHLKERLGQSAQYHDLMLRPLYAIHDLLLAILQPEAHRKRSIRAIYERTLADMKLVQQSGFTYLVNTPYYLQGLTGAAVLSGEAPPSPDFVQAFTKPTEDKVLKLIEKAKQHIWYARSTVACSMLSSGSESVHYMYHQQLILSVRQAVKCFRGAALAASNSTDKTSAVDFFAKSLLYMGLTGFLREEFARMAAVDDSYAWCTAWVNRADVDEAALRGYLQATLLGDTKSSLPYLYQQAVADRKRLFTLEVEKRAALDVMKSIDIRDLDNFEEALYKHLDHQQASADKMGAMCVVRSIDIRDSDDDDVDTDSAILALGGTKFTEKTAAAATVTMSTASMSKTIGTTASYSLASVEHQIRSEIDRLNRAGRILWRTTAEIRSKKPRDGKLVLCSDASLQQQTHEVRKYFRSHNDVSEAEKWDSLLKSLEIALRHK